MRYCALLRGIGPLNPNMRNEHLRGVIEGLGFTNVSTVITTGNVLFESESADISAMELLIEAAWPEKLDFTSTTIIRSRHQIRTLVADHLFGDIEDGPTSRLDVTFLKHQPEEAHAFPFTHDSGAFSVLGVSDRALFSVSDPTNPRTPEMMRWIHQRFGKEITTRAWTTVNRIHKRMQSESPT